MEFFGSGLEVGGQLSGIQAGGNLHHGLSRRFLIWSGTSQGQEFSNQFLHPGCLFQGFEERSAIPKTSGEPFRDGLAVGPGERQGQVNRVLVGQAVAASVAPLVPARGDILPFN